MMNRTVIRAFTLIELLVVIAIIGILSAMLLPVFASARESARRSSCLSNMRQIGMAIMAYTQDYDEFYPCNSWDAAVIGNPDHDGGRADFYTAWQWPWRIMPFMKSKPLLVCPSDLNPRDPRAYATGGTCDPGGMWDVPTPISYATNDEILGFGGFANPNGCQPPEPSLPAILQPHTLAYVPTPASTYLVADSGRISGLEAFWVNNIRAANYSRVSNRTAPRRGRRAEDPRTGRHYDPLWAGWIKQPAVFRHNRGQNIVFADGHTKWLEGLSINSGDDFFDLLHANHGVTVREY